MTAHLPLIADIANPQLTQALQHKLNHKTKPLGSLGPLEQLALRIGQILGTESPRLEQPQMVVFAGDHGLAARGVSAFPSDVTWQMVENFLAGGAAVSVLARQHGLALTVVDCGVARDFAPRAAVPGQPQLLVRKVAAGTQDASTGPAMTAAQCAQALENGMDVVRGLPGNALLLGEMGIGNTSVASLLLSRLCGVSLQDCTGAGTGLDATGVAWRPRWAAAWSRCRCTMSGCWSSRWPHCSKYTRSSMGRRGSQPAVSSSGLSWKWLT